MDNEKELFKAWVEANQPFYVWNDNMWAAWQAANLSKPQPTSQYVLDAKRWRQYACNQTALMLGSKLDPNDDSIDWLEECNKLADAAMKESK